MGTASPGRRLREVTPVGAYFLVVIGSSWTVWILGLPRTAGVGRLAVVLAGAWVPTVVALGFAGWADGRAGVFALLGRLARWRIAPRWYLLALGAVPAATALTVGVHVATSQPTPELTVPGGLGPGVLPIVFVVNLVVGGALAEELGWRGYAFPTLADRVGPVLAALVVGLVWAAWHLPFFLVFPDVGVAGGFPLWAYVPVLVSWSFLFSWSVDAAGGSVVVAVLLHASANTTLGTLGVVDPSNPQLLVTFVVVQLVLVGALVAWIGWGGDAADSGSLARAGRSDHNGWRGER